MKYLKTYKIFEGITVDFMEDIEEILLEVRDIGYTATLFWRESYINIIYEGVDEFIKFEEIKDCLLRLKQYLGKRYKCCKIYYDKEFDWIKFDLSEDSIITDDKLLGISIHYIM